jgi:HrpA-like RNA helicase
MCQQVVKISKAQANQRAGRSGRECPGKCYRLFTEDAFEELDTLSVPEIQRVNMSQVILQLKELGVQSPLDFYYLSPPSELSIKNALEMLFLLGALDKVLLSIFTEVLSASLNDADSYLQSQRLTQHGKNMAKLPLDPKYAHLLLKSPEFR